MEREEITCSRTLEEVNKRKHMNGMEHKPMGTDLNRNISERKMEKV